MISSDFKSIGGNRGFQLHRRRFTLVSSSLEKAQCFVLKVQSNSLLWSKKWINEKLPHIALENTYKISKRHGTRHQFILMFSKTIYGNLYGFLIITFNSSYDLINCTEKYIRSCILCLMHGIFIYFFNLDQIVWKQECNIDTVVFLLSFYSKLTNLWRTVKY